MKTTTLFHRASGGGVKVWTLRLEDDGTTLTTTWGLHGGRTQSVADPIKSKGKAGTKAFKTPQAVALEEYDRKVSKKKDEGYVENLDDVLHTVQAAPQPNGSTHVAARHAFDFDALPKSFAPAKPIADYRSDLATIKAIAARGDLYLQRKRDGGRHFLAIGPTKVNIYTRRMENVSSQFPDIVEALTAAREQLPGLACAIIDAEFVVDNAGKDDFATVGSICRSDPAKSIRNQRGVDSFFYAFDVLYASGDAIFGQPYRQRYELLNAMVLTIDASRLRIAALLDRSLDENIESAKAEGWEGLVAWDASKGTVVQLNGKPKRVNCWKVKPDYEEDFVATGYELGDSKFSNVVGALYISQYKDGVLVPCGRVGSGFDETTRAEALGWSYPCVVSVKFSERTPDLQLRFPVFQRLHLDKEPEECLLPTED